MNVVAFLNAVGVSPYIRDELFSGKNAIDVLARNLAAVSEISRVILLVGAGQQNDATWIAEHLESSGLSRELSIVELADRDASTAFNKIAELVKKDELVFFCRADAPHLHPGLSDTLIKNHKTWHAEYSFADGYPLGMSPEIISPAILPALATIAAQKNIIIDRHDAVFEAIKQDINAFEIETDIAPLDLRLLRIDLHCDTRQNTRLCRNLASLFEEMRNLGLESLLKEIKSRQELLRTLPSYFNIQISGGCLQVCSYCPWGQKGTSILHDSQYMNSEDFRALIAKIHAFAPESVISISLWGEPSRNPQIWSIIKIVREFSPLKLYIETSGLGWNPEELQAFAESGETDHVTWIVSLDSMDETHYRSMRGDGFAEALAAAHLFFRLFPKSAYIQAVRTKSNEEGLQKHYQYWKQLGALQIIQKYDHFSARLPDLRLSDIAPLDRNACWHLKRDMNVLLDGTVPLCREDYEAKQPMGNLFNEEISTVWDRLQAPYREHIAGRFGGICAGCDEYYTFNN